MILFDRELRVRLRDRSRKCARGRTSSFAGRVRARDDRLLPLESGIPKMHLSCKGGQAML